MHCPAGPAQLSGDKVERLSRGMKLDEALILLRRPNSVAVSGHLYLPEVMSDITITIARQVGKRIQLIRPASSAILRKRFVQSFPRRVKTFTASLAR